MSNPKKSKKSKKQPRPKANLDLPFWGNKDLLLPLLGILVLTFIAFSPSLSNDFVNWDDDVNILENTNLDALTWENITRIFHPETGRIIGNYNPLPIFTFAVEKHFFGLNPTVFHFDNLLLHLICVFFVYRVTLGLGMSRWGAVLVALLFGIHPMRVESVAWATERKDVLFGAVYFAAIWTYLKYLKTEKLNFYILTIVLFVFSLFSKIQAVALPLSLLAIDYYMRKPFKIGILINKVPFFALSLAFGVLGIYGLGSDGSLEDTTQYSFFERLAVGAYSYCIYLIKFILPYEMSPLYPYQKELPTQYYAGFLGAILMMILFFRAFKKGHRNTVFGIAFFTFNVVFVLQILSAGQGLLADRFTYVAYFGLFFLVAKMVVWLFENKPESGVYIKAGIGAYLVLFLAMTFQQNKVWKNGLVMWSHVNKLYPETHSPLANIGHYYRDKNNYPMAVEFYKKSLQKSKRAATFNSLGKIHFENGAPQKALENYNFGVAEVLAPKTKTEIKTKAEILTNRGTFYGSQGKMQLALADLSTGIQLNPKHANAYAMRSMVYFGSRDFEKALADYNTVIDLGSPSSDIIYEKGLVLNELSRFSEALLALNLAISMNPNKGLYYAERAQANLESGNKSAAIQDANRANEMGANVESGVLEQLR
ncbi:MAG: tetratricopeptide (TPR) repeat protein [Paraglaciecola sp.]|jgi:tetratricopeptide (TPR) repeat protein